MTGYPFIRTATQADYDVEWIGIATIDGVLRFSIANGNLTELTQTFFNPAELPITLYEDPEIPPTAYTDFTVPFSITKDFSGSVIVGLARAGTV